MPYFIYIGAIITRRLIHDSIKSMVLAYKQKKVSRKCWFSTDWSHFSYML